MAIRVKSANKTKDSLAMTSLLKHAIRLAAASAFWLSSAQAQRPLQRSLPLNEESFVFSHNAATGYVPEKSPLEDITVGFAKTQVGSLTAQADCGARAFDLRPAEINGGIFFRHGPFEVTEISFEDAVQETLDWAGANQGELILLKISACQEGSACDNRVASILQSKGVEFITNCNEFTTLTVGQALDRGPVLALAGDCFVQNYDETQNCHGFLPDNDPANVAAVRACADVEGEDVTAFIQAFTCQQTALTPENVNLYDCWRGSGTEDYPVNRLMTHLDGVASGGPPSNGRPWQFQALWQVSEDSIMLSAFRPVPLPPTIFSLNVTNILLDIEVSEVNRLVLGKVRQLVAQNRRLNLVEVDNVCDQYATQLLPALRSGTVPEPVTTPPPTPPPPPPTPPPTPPPPPPTPPPTPPPPPPTPPPTPPPPPPTPPPTPPPPTPPPPTPTPPTPPPPTPPPPTPPPPTPPSPIGPPTGPTPLPLTAAPSASPTERPPLTAVPSFSPTVHIPLTAVPSASPTERPPLTAVPSVSPTVHIPLTAVPSASPTAVPSASPTIHIPLTAVPSVSPTERPPPLTAVPSVSPTVSYAPTFMPSAAPSLSASPTASDTATPSSAPTTTASPIPADPTTTLVPTATPIPADTITTLEPTSTSGQKSAHVVFASFAILGIELVFLMM